MGPSDSGESRPALSDIAASPVCAASHRRPSLELPDASPNGDGRNVALSSRNSRLWRIRNARSALIRAPVRYGASHQLPRQYGQMPSCTRSNRRRPGQGLVCGRVAVRRAAAAASAADSRCSRRRRPVRPRATPGADAPSAPPPWAPEPRRPRCAGPPRTARPGRGSSGTSDPAGRGTGRGRRASPRYRPPRPPSDRRARDAGEPASRRQVVMARRHDVEAAAGPRRPALAGVAAGVARTASRARTRTGPARRCRRDPDVLPHALGIRHDVGLIAAVRLVEYARRRPWL